MSDSKIDILLLGSGGREHALLTKLAESPRAGKMWVAPGNGGMDATAEVADLDPESPEGVAAWVDPEGYRRFIASKKRAFEDEVDAEMGVKK